MSWCGRRHLLSTKDVRDGNDHSADNESGSSSRSSLMQSLDTLGNSVPPREFRRSDKLSFPTSFSVRLPKRARLPSKHRSNGEALRGSRRISAEKWTSSLAFPLSSSTRSSVFFFTLFLYPCPALLFRPSDALPVVFYPPHLDDAQPHFRSTSFPSVLCWLLSA